MSGENLCNCTNLLHSGFCLGWPVVFLQLKSFPHKSLSHLFFLVYLFVLVDILLRLISGFSPTSGIRVDGSLVTKMSVMKFDVEKFYKRINFGLWKVQVKDLLIQSRLHKALKGEPITSSGEDSTRFEVSKSTISDED